MKFVLMSLVLVQTCLGMDMMLQKIVKQTEKHVLENSCFGPGNKQKFDLAIGESIEKCLQLAPTNDLLNVLSPSSPMIFLMFCLQIVNFLPCSQLLMSEILSNNSRPIKILTNLCRCGEIKDLSPRETQRDCSVLMKMTSWSSLTTLMTSKRAWQPRLVT